MTTAAMRVAVVGAGAAGLTTAKVLLRSGLSREFLRDLQELRRLGADFGQGHLFSAALPAAKVSDLMAKDALSYSGISPAR